MFLGLQLVSSVGKATAILYKRFFACDGDAIFQKCPVASMRPKSRVHPPMHRRHNKFVLINFCQEKFSTLNFSRFFLQFFSAVASPMRRWLHMQFLPHTGNSLKKIRITVTSKKLLMQPQLNGPDCKVGGGSFERRLD